MPRPLARPVSTRQDKCKFRYNKDDAGFVELADENMSPEQLLETLRNVPGVEEVTWKPFKHDQGNSSAGAAYEGRGYFHERNVVVKSSIFPKPFEFELTRSLHKPNARETCSMAFKTSMVWYAIDSKAARAMCASEVPRVNPKIVPLAS